jgi:hypothetical protein
MSRWWLNIISDNLNPDLSVQPETRLRLYATRLLAERSNSFLLSLSRRWVHAGAAHIHIRTRFTYGMDRFSA